MSFRSVIKELPWRIGLSTAEQFVAIFAGVLAGSAALAGIKIARLQCDPVALNAVFYLALLAGTAAALWCVPPFGALAGKLGIRGFRRGDLSPIFVGLAVVCLTHLCVSPLWGGALHALGVDYAASQDFIRLCRGAAPLRFAALAAVAGVLIPVAEELVFRRLVFGMLRPLGALPALLTASLIFSVLHFFLYGFWALWVLGGAFQWIYLRTGNLAACIAAHMAFNIVSLAAAFCFGG